MNLEFSHKPNYFFFAQTFIRHLEQGIKKHPENNETSIELASLTEVFRQDFAATTTSLEPILNICDEYTVETLNGDQSLIAHYKVNLSDHTLLIQFNQEARLALLDGKPIHEPDATSYK